MGQEASLPQNADGDASLEEQAKAPPSSTNPTPLVTSGRSTRKLMGARFRGGGGSNQQQQQQAAHDNYEYKESARAAAAAGNLYLDDGSGDMAATPHPNGGPQGAAAASGTHHHVPSSLLAQEQLKEYHQSQSQLPVPYYDAGNAAAEPPVVGIMYEKQPQSPRKGIFAGKAASARGASLINSMRNLSLGGALRQNKQPKANDWETQWDQDEDDDSEEEDQDESYDQQTKMPATPSPATASLPLHQMQQPDAMLLAQQLAYPSVADQQHRTAAHLVTTDSMAATTTMSQSNLILSTASHQHQQHQQYAVEVDDGLEWDTGAKAAEEIKPNVQMFMPMLRVLGKGSFGKVVLVQKRVGKERGQLFAMKILRKTHLVKRRQIERTRTERKVLSLVNHPFIMKLHYAFQTADKLYLVLDYCPGGELFFHLSRFRRFPERVARFYAAELLLAIGHLHKRGIIYRDLKPENVLLDAEGHVKLGDFGLAKAGITHPLEGAMSMCGTPEYMAPEVLAQQGHGFCVDYWGLGMIVYEMMTGLPPWYTTDRAKLFRKLKSAPLDIPSYFNVHSANCVIALLERDPRRRLGVTGIRTAMEHEFFRNISWRALYARRVEAPIRPCEGWTAPEAIKCDGGDGNGMAPDRASAFVDYADIEEMNSNDLEAATQNFDNQFTRMPVQSVDSGSDVHPDDRAAAAELNENTFRGFSFDGKERENSGIPTIPSTPTRQPQRPYPLPEQHQPNLLD